LRPKHKAWLAPQTMRSLFLLSFRQLYAHLKQF
jgi:hypothetical protein